MSSLFSTPKQAPVMQEIAPAVVDNSDKVNEEENRRKKRKGYASSLIAGNDDTKDALISKSVLGS